MAPPAASVAVERAAVLLRGRPYSAPALEMQALRRLYQGGCLPSARRPQFPPQRLPFHRVSSPVLRPSSTPTNPSSAARPPSPTVGMLGTRTTNRCPSFSKRAPPVVGWICRWCWTPPPASVRGRHPPARSTIRVRRPVQDMLRACGEDLGREPGTSSWAGDAQLEDKAGE